MKTGATNQDNLLAGMGNILAMQDKHEARADGRHHEDQPTGAADDHYDGDEGDDAPHDEETGGAPKNSTATTYLPPPSPPSSFQRRHAERVHNLRIWYHDLIEPKLPHFIKATTHSILYIIVPLLAVAFILYYGVGNPIAGGTDVFDDVEEHASWSLWVLLLLRQIIVLLCVKGGEVVIIDILALRTPLFLKTVGVFATLMIVQARGWPYVLTLWSISDFCFLFGDHAFARHWLFWQDWIDLFNASNPAGSFLHSNFYLRLLCAMMFVGVVASLKRLWLATFLGRRSFAHYGPELEIILAKMLLVSQVAHLARQIESQVVSSRVFDEYAYTMSTIRSGKTITFEGLATDSEDENSPSQKSPKSLEKEKDNESSSEKRNGFGQALLDAGIGSKLVSSLSRPRGLMKSSMQMRGSSERLEIFAMLEEWDEPDIKTNASVSQERNDHVPSVCGVLFYLILYLQPAFLIVQSVDQGHSAIQTGCVSHG